MDLILSIESEGPDDWEVFEYIPLSEETDPNEIQLSDPVTHRVLNRHVTLHNDEAIIINYDLRVGSGNHFLSVTQNDESIIYMYGKGDLSVQILTKNGEEIMFSSHIFK